MARTDHDGIDSPAAKDEDARPPGSRPTPRQGVRWLAWVLGAIVIAGVVWLVLAGFAEAAATGAATLRR